MNDEKTPDNPVANPAINESTQSVSGSTPNIQLGYESPKDRIERAPNLHVLDKLIMPGFGALVGIGVVFFVSVFVFSAIGMPLEGPPDAATIARARVVGILYAAGFFGPVFLLFRFVRRTNVWTFGRWFILGCLIGLGIAMLIEGLCFGFT